MKIYTRTGDAGETGLVGGARARKDDPRVDAYGQVDELNAVLGVCRTEAEPDLSELLGAIQRDLFALGAQLADPRGRIASDSAKAALAPTRLTELEGAIDRAEAALPALRAFVLPGGARLGAHLHLARTVCRRAERAVVGLAPGDPAREAAVAYLNRLSDLLFVLARQANHAAGHAEEEW